MGFKRQYQIVAFFSALSISLMAFLVGILYVEANTHSPIAIYSDSDFALLGFAGDGTINNPIFIQRQIIM